MAPLRADVAPGKPSLVPLYEVIRGNVHKLYRGMELTATTLVRLTRDAEVEIDNNSDEVLSELVKEQIRQRRYEPVVRLEFAPGADPALRDMLRTRFDLLPVDIYDMPDEVDYTTLFEIAGMQLPELRDPAWSPIPCQHSPTAIPTSLPSSKPMICSCTTLTTALIPAWNTSYARPRMIL